MIDLDNLSLKQILPSNLAADETVSDIATVIENTLQEISTQIYMCVLLPRLDELPDNILNEIAWQYHVDFYQDTLERETKIKLIKTSIAMHKLKGTPYAVEKVCTDVFKSAQVVENWEYGGQPYHFKVAFIQEPVTDLNKINNLINAINTAKNVRSWCDEIGFITEQAGNIYFGGDIGVFDVVELNQMEYRPKDVIGESFFGGGLDIFEIQNINKGSDI